MSKFGEIKRVFISNNKLTVEGWGWSVSFEDEGHLCCELRHMSTDDDLSALVGEKYLGYEVLPGPETQSEYDVIEAQFLRIKTDKSTATVVNYNEHNGFYSGFALRVRESYVVGDE